MIRSAALLRSVLPRAANGRRLKLSSPSTSYYYSKTTIVRGLGTSSSSTFLNGSSAAYVDGMWARWKQDPESVHASWDTYFRAVDAGASPEAAFVSAEEAAAAAITPGSGGGISSQHLEEATKLLHLIRAYQVRGHEHAALDPLGVAEVPDIPELSRTTYGWSEASLESPIVTATNFKGLSGFAADADLDKDGKTTVGEVLQTLRQTYSSSIGVEYMHIPDREQCNWIRSRIEVEQEPLSTEERKSAYERLCFATRFEEYLGVKKGSAKRFGLDGAESLIPGMKFMVDKATELGVEDIVIGMPHRGRLNVMVNVMRKPAEIMFQEFKGLNAPDAPETNISLLHDDAAGDWSGSGDVKYHLGTSMDRTYPDGRSVHLALLANPSHLEAVNPVVQGKARAKMHYKGDSTGHTVMPVMLHGDAAYAGQGVVYETACMSNLKNYHAGGTVHIVVNNQIGFTTDPECSRSTKYCTALATAYGAPIFHVNADDVDAVVRVFNLAVEWRQTWHTDVMIDLIGYRRFGHNEIDEPMFTQPLMYEQIKNQRKTLDLYRDELIASGVHDEASAKATDAVVAKALDDAWEASDTYDAVAETNHQWLDSRWKGFFDPNAVSPPRATGASEEHLAAAVEVLSRKPDGFTMHPRLDHPKYEKKPEKFKGVWNKRCEALRAGVDLDWACAEQLAFGTLMQEGTHVRLSGQDVQRGTFSHRHAVFHDQKNGEKFVPLDALEEKGAASFHPCNSPLSEFGVLGFELGYSLENPNALVMWEAQFGDFVNGAQIIIDQFISSGEEKWHRQSGLVMMLPHGYDGQGPEHSSCRIERFLQNCNEDPDNADVVLMDEERRTQIQDSNWQIVNCSTPANYFHVLRRQIHRGFRKPLIIATPKALLREPECVSTMEELAEGTRFQRLIPETDEADIKPKKVRRLIFCSGKIYYELRKARREQGIKDVAIVRVEQISPFPYDLVAEQAAKYGDAEIVWVQEEAKNMGCWHFVQDRIMTATGVINEKEVRPGYVGRKTEASPASGYGEVHNREQSAIIEVALGEDVVSWGHGRRSKE